MKMNELLLEGLPEWICDSKEPGEVVLSSRVRLARNISEIPFPNRADDMQLEKVMSAVKGSMDAVAQEDRQGYDFADLKDLTELDRYILVEKHVISPQHAKEGSQRGLLVSSDVAVSVMVNEEDHVRLQCMQSGLNLEKALQKANKVDDALEGKMEYAFDEQWGYLTACPTNLGTGLRASVMVHLPGLVFTRQISQVINGATQLGLAVRGLYGEGTESAGNVFQISNQITMGKTEEEIVANLHSVAVQVTEMEQAARQLLQKESGHILEDRVWRAYGILSHARRMPGPEALGLLSELRLGIDMGVMKGVPANIFNELLATTRTNYLQKIILQNQGNEGEDIDHRRAMVIRNTLLR